MNDGCAPGSYQLCNGCAMAACGRRRSAAGTPATTPNSPPGVSCNLQSCRWRSVLAVRPSRRPAKHLWRAAGTALCRFTMTATPSVACRKYCYANRKAVDCRAFCNHCSQIVQQAFTICVPAVVINFFVTKLE